MKNANVSKRSTTIINFEKYGKAISLIIFPKHSQHKKIRFPLRISSVNVTKSAGNIWSHLLKKFLKETSFLCSDVFEYCSAYSTEAANGGVLLKKLLSFMPILKKTPTQVFSCEYCEIRFYFENICERLVL